MQKKLIALAIASMATGAAFAQSADTVTLYGRADVGIVSRSGHKDNVGQEKRTTEVASGIAAGSRIGVKGVENLGNGLSALFLAEFGIDMSDSANRSTSWWNRQSYVGFKSDVAGTALLGRQYDFRYNNMYGKYDPFQLGTVGNMVQLGTQITDRANNTIAYVTPNWSGFSGALAYSNQVANSENVRNDKDLRWYGLLLGYDNYGISVSGNYEQAKAKDSSTKYRAFDIGASYTYQGIQFSGMYDRYQVKDSGTTLAKEDAYFLGLRAPVGPVVIKAGVGQNRDKVDRGGAGKGRSTKYGIGLDYVLSKRTSLYMDYGKVSVKNGGSGAYNINTQYGNDLTTYTGTDGVTRYGKGTSGFDIGIAHNF